jgi:ribose transport system substrate-binding protein
MKAVYATGEPALIGAIAAARSQNVTDRIHIFGWDLSPDAVQGIKDGFVQAVVQQDPYTEGVDAVQSALKLSQGESVPATIQVPIAIVTKANVAQYESKVY